MLLPLLRWLGRMHLVWVRLIQKLNLDCSKLLIRADSGRAGNDQAENMLQGLRTGNMLQAQQAAGALVSISKILSVSIRRWCSGMQQMEMDIQRLLTSNELAGATGMGNLQTAKQQIAAQRAAASLLLHRQEPHLLQQMNDLSVAR